MARPRAPLLLAAATAALLATAALEARAPAGDAPPSRPPAGGAAASRLLGPRHEPQRSQALSRGGGTAETERAAAAALDWLARHALPEGGWDADGFAARCAQGGPACTGVGRGQHGEDVPCPFDDAISALAVMAFLGRGHGPWAQGDPHGPLVERTLERLRRTGDPWALALATQALAEAEALEGKGRWREDALGGARRLLEARGEDGAWGYAAGFRPGSDVPYASLVVQALVAARDLGAELPGDLAPRVDAWLSSLEEDDGRLAYLKDGRAYGYTPTTANAHAAAQMREWLRAGTGGARHRAHMGLVRREAPEWKIGWKDLVVPGRGKMRVQVGSLSLYQWWLGGLAAFQAGGETWGSWFARARSALVPHQRKDGCARGSWDPEGTYERQTGGRVLATALGALILEGPYRHQRLAPAR